MVEDYRGDPNLLVLARYDEGAAAWVVHTTTVDTVGRTLSLTTTEFSDWIVLAKTPTPGLPIWAWIAIGVGGAAVLAGIVVALRRPVWRREAKV